MNGGNFTTAIDADKVPEKGFTCIDVDGVALVICRFRDEYFALENMCSHARSDFEGGRVRGYNLFCPLHGGSFDIRDGSATGKPARRPIRSFTVRVVDGTVEVDLDSSIAESPG